MVFKHNDNYSKKKAQVEKLKSRKRLQKIVVIKTISIANLPIKLEANKDKKQCIKKVVISMIETTSKINESI